MKERMSSFLAYGGGGPSSIDMGEGFSSPSTSWQKLRSVRVAPRSAFFFRRRFECVGLSLCFDCTYGHLCLDQVEEKPPKLQRAPNFDKYVSSLLLPPEKGRRQGQSACFATVSQEILGKNPQTCLTQESRKKKRKRKRIGMDCMVWIVWTGLRSLYEAPRKESFRGLTTKGILS